MPKKRSLVTLSAEERRQITELTRKGTSLHGKLARAHMLRGADG